MNKKEAGNLGGLARIKKYGNPGTSLGRSKGGIKSVAINKANKTGFILAKKHVEPVDSPLLAEFLGIMFGDGHLSNYQVSVTTNSQTDMEHAVYIKKIIKNLFHLEASIKLKKSCNAVDVVVSSVNLVKWLKLKGMPSGNKLKSGLFIPKWVKNDIVFSQRFIRGLFDTDGCVYSDNHLIKGKVYKSQAMAITSYSESLREEVFVILKGLGYNPTLRSTQKSVYLRRKNDIVKYFKEIGTRNPKHQKRYLAGRVPKRL